jgi:hypothetical protein
MELSQLMAERLYSGFVNICGNRASIQWRRERWAALPTQTYHGITFTMPGVLWPPFRDNTALTKALPVLAAGVIRAQVVNRYRKG